MLGFFSMPGGWEWFVILVALLLLFGHRLPSVMRNMGRSVSEFKKGMKDIGEEPTASGTDQKPTQPAKDTEAPPKSKTEA